MKRLLTDEEVGIKPQTPATPKVYTDEEVGLVPTSQFNRQPEWTPENEQVAVRPDLQPKKLYTDEEVGLPPSGASELVPTVPEEKEKREIGKVYYDPVLKRNLQWTEQGWIYAGAKPPEPTKKPDTFTSIYSQIDQKFPQLKTMSPAERLISSFAYTYGELDETKKALQQQAQGNPERAVELWQEGLGKSREAFDNIVRMPLQLQINQQNPDDLEYADSFILDAVNKVGLPPNPFTNYGDYLNYLDRVYKIASNNYNKFVSERYKQYKEQQERVKRYREFIEKQPWYKQLGAEAARAATQIAGEAWRVISGILYAIPLTREFAKKHPPSDVDRLADVVFNLVLGCTPTELYEKTGLTPEDVERYSQSDAGRRITDYIYSLSAWLLAGAAGGAKGAVSTKLGSLLKTSPRLLQALGWSTGFGLLSAASTKAEGGSDEEAFRNGIVSSAIIAALHLVPMAFGKIGEVAKRRAYLRRVSKAIGIKIPSSIKTAEELRNFLTNAFKEATKMSLDEAYKRLRLPRNASPEQIRRAYERIQKVWARPPLKITLLDQLKLKAAYKTALRNARLEGKAVRMAVRTRAGREPVGGIETRVKAEKPAEAAKPEVRALEAPPEKPTLPAPVRPKALEVKPVEKVEVPTTEVKPPAKAPEKAPKLPSEAKTVEKGIEVPKAKKVPAKIKAVEEDILNRGLLTLKTTPLEKMPVPQEVKEAVKKLQNKGWLSDFRYDPDLKAWDVVLNKKGIQRLGLSRGYGDAYAGWTSDAKTLIEWANAKPIKTLPSGYIEEKLGRWRAKSIQEANKKFLSSYLPVFEQSQRKALGNSILLQKNNKEFVRVANKWQLEAALQDGFTVLKKGSNTGWADDLLKEYNQWAPKVKKVAPETEIKPSEAKLIPETEIKPKAEPLTRRIISEERYQQAVKHFAEKGKKLYAGVPIEPKDLQEASVFVLYHFENGVRKLKDLIKLAAGKIKEAVIRKAWRETKEARRAILHTENILKGKITDKQQIIDLIRSELPLSKQTKYLAALAKVKTKKGIQSVADKVRQEIIDIQRQMVVQPAGKEVVMTPEKLLRTVFKKEQMAARKAYLQGAKDVVRNHEELVAYARMKLGDTQATKLLNRVVRVRTPADFRRVVASIDRLADKAKLRSAKAELAQAFKEAKKLPIEQAEAIEAIKDALSLRKYRASSIEKAKKIIQQAQDGEFFPEVVLNKAREVLDSLHKIDINNLSADQIREIADTVRTITAIGRQINEVRFANKVWQAKQFIKENIETIAKRKGVSPEVLLKVDLDAPKVRIWNKVYDFTVAELLTPETIAARIAGKDSLLAKIFGDYAQEGISKTLGLRSQYRRDFYTKCKRVGITEKDIANAFSDKLYEVKVSSTYAIKRNQAINKVKITKGEAMCLYAGYTFDPYFQYAVLHDGIRLGHTKPGNAIRLSPQDIEKMFSILTPKEKAIAKYLVEPIQKNGWFGKELNKAWDNVFGHEIARRESYFPLSREKEEVFARREPNPNIRMQMARLYEQTGYFKPRKGGGSPVVIRNIFDHIDRYIQYTSNFIGKGEITHNLLRIINDTDFKDAIRKAYPKHGDTYLSILERGVRQYGQIIPKQYSPVDRAIGKLLEHFHIGAIGFKPHVGLYQTASIVNASTEVSFQMRDFARAASPTFRRWVDKHIPEIEARYLSSTWEILTPAKEGGRGNIFLPSRGESKIGRVSMELIRQGDKEAIYAIAAAFERMGKARGLSGSKLIDFVRRNTNRVIRRTQPSWDNPMGLAGLQLWAREGSPLRRMFLLFTNQRIKNFNMTYRGITEWVAGERSFGSMIDHVLRSAIINSLAVAAAGYGWKELAGAFTSKDKHERRWKLGRFVEETIRRTLGNWVLWGDWSFSLIQAVQDKEPFEPMANPIGQAMQDLVVGIGQLVKAGRAYWSGEVVATGEKKGELKWKQHFAKGLRRSLTNIGLLSGVPLAGLIQIYRAINREKPSAITEAMYLLANGEKLKAREKLLSLQNKFEKYYIDVYKKEYGEKAKGERAYDWARRQAINSIRRMLLARPKYEKGTGDYVKWQVLVDSIIPPYNQTYQDVIAKHVRKFAIHENLSDNKLIEEYLYLKFAGLNEKTAVDLLKKKLYRKKLSTSEFIGIISKVRVGIKKAKELYENATRERP
ncbi:MAG: hypothetical protein DRN20_00465 [Thermoplasmata archaeon]|mgnify:CR=1 FL=1|nr:MAG: hypothetical protein DRN20_00465 [Thermoplasmata archaeon]